ncbi:MAG: hypothetical protein IT426_01560 [Pirellulales bacterium]|nr:hypothetical protein [Pirellulales bacterium]
MATALPPSSTDKPGVQTQYRKPKADLYTLLLAIALAAILVAIIFLCLYNGVFEWKMTDNIPTGTIVRDWGVPVSFLGFFG